jgi:hypothetical protein
MIRSPTMRARLAFALAEADAKLRWRLGRVPRFDPQLAAGPFMTLVGYLPQNFATELAEFVAVLPAIGDHFRYPAGQLHVTIRNLDGADLAGLPVLLDGLPPIRLRGDGFGFTGETLLLRAIPADDILLSLRRELDGFPGVRPATPLRREAAFANVVRLNGPVARELRRTVRRSPDAIGRKCFELSELRLVRTDKIGSPTRTEVIERFSLG